MKSPSRGLQSALATSRQAGAELPRSAPEVATPQPAVTVEQPSAGLGSPYIDSFLCTSCNDCINLNPRLFRYNENKQAEIGDPGAGTFKELVKAAEACPARCIHPGAPRAGDTTATPAMIQRAAKFS